MLSLSLLSSSPSKDAVIRRLGLPTGFKCNVPVRRQEDRRQLDARACHQCELVSVTSHQVIRAHTHTFTCLCPLNPPTLPPFITPSSLTRSLLCQWYKDNPGRMKQSCRHKELHQRSDTPADFFRVDFTPTQEDSQHT